jgi:hypothetical protein
LTSADVVRHVLVQRIINAYEKYEANTHDAHSKSKPETAKPPQKGRRRYSEKA